MINTDSFYVSFLPTFACSFSFGLLKAELVRHPELLSSDYIDYDGYYVFNGVGVEVRVPSSFLVHSRITGDQNRNCASVAASSLGVDFAATKMFPDSPPTPEELEPDERDYVQDGLHAVVADFTSFGLDLVLSRDSAGDIHEDVVTIFEHIDRVNC